MCSQVDYLIQISVYISRIIVVFNVIFLQECPCGLGLCNQTSTDNPTATATQALEKLTKDNTQHLMFSPDLQVHIGVF